MLQINVQLNQDELAAMMSLIVDGERAVSCEFMVNDEGQMLMRNTVPGGEEVFGFDIAPGDDGWPQIVSLVMEIFGNWSRGDISVN